MTTSIKTNIQAIVDSIAIFKDSLTNEEITKQSLVLPFISALGYNVFSPFDVQAELTCDILKQKGEKVDYAIMQNNNPAIIIECKKYNENLSIHQAQLARYFAATNAKFGILTNGTQYMFYTDTEKENLMDNTPFFAFDIQDMTDAKFAILEQFSKALFNENLIYNTANSLKTFSTLKTTLQDALETPSPELVKLICKDIHNGRFTDSVLNTYTDTFKRVWQSIKNDIIQDNLNIIIKQNTPKQNCIETDTTTTQPKKEIVTTNTEIEAYHYIKAIIANIIEPNRIILKDALNACNICMDNQRYSICHLLFNNENKLKLEINDTIYNINTPQDIFNYKNELINAATLLIAK